jgi:hypothetical protein
MNTTGDDGKYMDTEFRANYPFIRKDIQLCAIVNSETGKQTLVMEKFNASGAVEFSDSIDCIHTAILTITKDELEESTDTQDARDQLQEDIVKQHAIINAQSSEDLVTITLEPEEKFKAFRSWVAGIAESGLQAFKIQSQIENEAKLIIPVTRPIMKFLMKIDTNLILDFIRILEKECIFEGIQHESSLIANLIPILEIIADKPSDPQYRLILKAVFQMNPPLRLFNKESKFTQLLEYPEATEMDQFPSAYRSEQLIRKHIILNPKATEFEEYSVFLNHKTEIDCNLRIIAASNLKSTRFSHYSNFLSIKTEPDSRVRKAAAKNPNASQFEEFSNFLSIKTEQIAEVRKIAAKHPDAASFPEFTNLLSFMTEPDEIVRRIAARNPDATRFKEYKNFFSYQTEPDILVRYIAALNPNALEFKEYHNLVSETAESIPEIREIAKKMIEHVNKSSTPISEKDFEKYDFLKAELNELKTEFEDDNSHLITQIEKMRQDLFPPDVVSKMQDDVSRELIRLKQMVQRPQTERIVENKPQKKTSAKKTHKKTSRNPGNELE